MDARPECAYLVQRPGGNGFGRGLSSFRMGLTVTFVSGPRRAGKSAMVCLMIERLWKSKPHYIRLVRIGSDKVPPKPPAKPLTDCGVSSARWLNYDADRIFEILPDALTAIHRRDRYGGVVIEADADPILRHAYPYDHRVFVMPMPESVDSVFRDPAQAAGELRRVLDDTADFASEIFGLFERNGLADSDPPEPRPGLSPGQLRGFLYSPLGDELATRIQLQPPYHGLVESDVVVVNPAGGCAGPESEVCLRRIEHLLERVRGRSGRRSELYVCDPTQTTGKVGRALLKALKPMAIAGK